MRKKYGTDFFIMYRYPLQVTCLLIQLLLSQFITSRQAASWSCCRLCMAQ